MCVHVNLSHTINIFFFLNEKPTTMNQAEKLEFIHLSARIVAGKMAKQFIMWCANLTCDFRYGFFFVGLFVK